MAFQPIVGDMNTEMAAVHGFVPMAKPETPTKYLYTKMATMSCMDATPWSI